jgi:hypothetical protein
VEFTTIFEYLLLLREAARAVAPLGSRALVYLAAAVSDFYVPPAEMVVHKIQSRASDGLTIHLRNVPKVLGLLRDEWCPEAVLCSFKLETNANILRAKSAGALKAYRVDAVVANVLQTRASEVTIFRASPGVTPAVLGPVHADATAEVPTAGVVGARIALDGLSSGTLEDAIVNELLRSS